MEPTDGTRDADRETQESADLHRRADQPIERLAAGVLEDEDGAAPVALEPNRPNSPSRIELGRQRVLVPETRQGCGRDVLACRSHDEHTGSALVHRAGTRGSVQDELSILAERRKRVVYKINHPARGNRPRCGRSDMRDSW